MGDQVRRLARLLAAFHARAECARRLRRGRPGRDVATLERATALVRPYGADTP
ncbi:MAG TPA: hypothetical protein VFR67_05660 [Pilimelia sp.]|nr:hypothetical protein [Pilimelia sp.]